MSGASSASENQDAASAHPSTQWHPAHRIVRTDPTDAQRKTRDQGQTQVKNSKAREQRHEVVDGIREIQILLEVLARINIRGKALQSGNYKTSGLQWRKKDGLEAAHNLLGLFVEDEAIKAHRRGQDVGTILNGRLDEYVQRKESGNTLLESIAVVECKKSKKDKKNPQVIKCVAHGLQDYNKCRKAHVMARVEEMLRRLDEPDLREDSAMLEAE